MGNKIDLFEEEEVIEKEGKNLAKSKGMKINFVSAKCDNTDIKDFIEELVYDYLSTNNLKKLNKNLLKT